MEQHQKTLKTWSHLSGNRKKPSEYDVVTKKLHYSTNNKDAPWELSPSSPMNSWYKNYRNNSKLKAENWDDFSDPDQLVYRTYNLMQDGQESHVFSLFDQFSERGHDFQIEKEWVSLLAKIYTPLRYLYHGVQMSSSYLAQMAPASTITNCATFQTSDYLRFTTHTAYRTYELSQNHPDINFNSCEREAWEKSEYYQGFRKLIEKNLITYDWGECFVSLSGVIIPAVMEGVLKPLSEESKNNNDLLLSLVIDSQIKDVERHIKWARKLTEFYKSSNGGGVGPIDEWTDKWKPLGKDAILAYLDGFESSSFNKDEIISKYENLMDSVTNRGS